jgi:predicted anti-sigma-YlaC factor YlaD
VSVCPVVLQNKYLWCCLLYVQLVVVMVQWVVVSVVVQHGVGTVECVVPCNSALHMEYDMGHSVV